MAILAREGAQTQGEVGGELVWRFVGKTPEGIRFEVRCTGPDLPTTVPAEAALPSDIPKHPKWRGTYRLVVAPPLVAFDICWRLDEPLRIMTFSRGDWEARLADMTTGSAAS